tara:strand:+ start:1334 stop:5857 length:4524 start_codon:yes stop_codon:yes gene_type:complete
VEELPDLILDKAFAYHAWFENNMAIGYGEAAPEVPNQSGYTFGNTIDQVSAGRWAGIQPVPGSWIINKIMCANGTVFLCGNYRCKLNYNQWAGTLDRTPGLEFDLGTLDAAWQSPFVEFNGFMDGFFAACKYDEMTDPAAWHILPMRSQIELPESPGPALNDPYFTGGEPIGQQNNQQGGLMDMCIDDRTFNTYARNGWEAMEPELSGNGAQPLVIQCVGYMPCEGYGSVVHNSTNITDGYKWSIYSNQDFLPVMYSFVINIFNDKYTGTDSATVNDTINPQYKNSQITSLNSGIGGVELEDMYSYWGYNWLIGGSNSFGQNPIIPLGYGQPDQCGSGMATQGAFSGAVAGAAAGTFQAQYFGTNNLAIPWCSVAARYGSIQVYPFEQVTYRAHQIGIELTQIGGDNFYPRADTTSTFTYENKSPRQPNTFPFCPTPFVGQFPIRKPAEMAFATSNYLACKARYQGNGLENWPTTGQCEYNPKPNYWTPLMRADRPATAITDAEIWRHGFIPRQLTGITTGYNTSAGTLSFQGSTSLFYPTFENNAYGAGFPDFANFNPLFPPNPDTDVTSAISYQILTGNCLEDVTVNPNSTLASRVDAVGKPIYSPLCVIASVGQSYASPGVLGDFASALEKGIPLQPFVGPATTPEISNYGNNTWYKCFTRRNIAVEDVNAENACNLTVAPTNSSLDNATFVKPLPTVRANYPAINNQIFNVPLLLQVNELIGGANEKRAEIYLLQPWLATDSKSGVSFDTRTIVPYLTWYGWAEAAIARKMVPVPGVNTTCKPQTDDADFTTDGYLDSAVMPSEWMYTQTQGTSLTIPNVDRQKNCFHTYREGGTYAYGDFTGLGQSLLGYWRNRVVGGIGWKPFDGVGNPLTGPTVHVMDPGNIDININPVINSWTTIAEQPVWGGVYRLGVPFEGAFAPQGFTTSSPDIYDQHDLRYNAAVQTNIPIPQQYLSIPTTNKTKVGPVIAAGNLWSDPALGARFNYDITINGNELGQLRPIVVGATTPPGTGDYTTMRSLVGDINTTLDYFRSSGPPYSQPYSLLNPIGLANIECFQTSDGEGIYFRDSVQINHVGLNLELGRLLISHTNSAAIEAAGSEYYPWNTDGGFPYQYYFQPSFGPLGVNNFGDFTWSCAAVVEEPAYNSSRFNIKNYGNTMNKLCPGGASTTRRAVCTDFDLDRAQWMFTFADNDKLVSEVGNGFAAISVTPDFNEFLDQTKNFTNIPDFYALTQDVFETATTSIFASSLWAARQGSANLDGLVWIGMADYNTTETYPSATGIQDTSLSYVWANYFCFRNLPDYPPDIGPYSGQSWTEGGYTPFVTYAGLGPFLCYDGNTAYKITGTTGRKVQVWLNYVLYDEIDSIIAVEIQTLGLRVTPENVEWYKRKILGQSGAEMSLEEIEEWMEKQRQQYQSILKNRNHGWKMRRRREQSGTHKPSATEELTEQLAGDFYALDEESIEKLLPQLNLLPPNPDTDALMDVDAFGNSSSGDIQKTEEKRRDSEN